MADEFISVAAEIDLSAWTSHIATLEDDADLLDDLQDVDLTATFDVDDSELLDADRLLEGLDTSVSPTIETDDSDLLTADRLLEDIDSEEATPEINADSSGLDDAASTLETIKNLSIINTVWNIAGTAVDLLGKGAEFLAAPILEYDTALSQVEARTGNMLPNARELISDLFTDGWGESREEVGGVITLADQLNVSMEDLGDAAEAAFQVSAVTSDDANTSLRTVVNTANEMGITYSEAADLIVAGTQDGANAAGDLQEALVEFGPKFREMRISGEGALAIIESGLENGAKDASTVADGIKELGTNISKIGTDQGVTDAFNKLDSLSDIDLSGALDAYNEGKITGDEFYQGIFDALTDASAVDPQAAQQIGATLIGSKSEDVGVSLFANLSTQFDDTAEEIEGRAEEAGETIHDNLTSEFTEVTRSIQDNIAEYLEDSTEFDTFLDNLKTGVRDAIDALKNGDSLEDSITVGLKPLGLDDDFARLESTLGNFVLDLQTALLGIVEALPGDQGESGLRQRIASGAASQLAFDLEISNPEDFSTKVQAALDRGVDQSTINNLATETVGTLVSQGDVDKAQQLVDYLSQGQAVVKAFELGKETERITIPITPEMTVDDINAAIADAQAELRSHSLLSQINTDVSTFGFTSEQIATMQGQVDEAGRQLTIKDLQVAPDVKVQTGNGLLDPTQLGFGAAGGNAAAGLGDLTGKGDQAGASLQNVTSALADQEAQAEASKVALDSLSQGTDDYTTAADNAALVNSGVVDSFGDLFAAAQEAADQVASGATTMSDAMAAADESITNSISGNSMIPELEALSASAVTESATTVEAMQAIDDVTFFDAEAGIEALIYRLELLSAQANATGAAIETASANANSSGSSGGSSGGSNSGGGSNPTSTSSLTLNQTNHIYSSAQAGSVSQQTADALGVGLG